MWIGGIPYARRVPEDDDDPDALAIYEGAERLVGPGADGLVIFTVQAGKVSCCHIERGGLRSPDSFVKDGDCLSAVERYFAPDGWGKLRVCVERGHATYRNIEYTMKV